MYYNIEGNDVNVILLEHANGVPGSVWQNEDGSYTIFIDASLAPEKQKEVLLHEIYHILNWDFEKFDVREIETEAHNNSDKPNHTCLYS